MNIPAPDSFVSVSNSAIPINADAGVGERNSMNIASPQHARTTRQEAIRRWQRWERMILLPILILVFFGLFNFKMGQVQGRSMSPLYETGDKLLLLKSYKVFSPVKVGDIVVVKLKHGKYAGEEWVKRVVFIQNAEGNAKWGETIATSRDRKIPLHYWFNDYFMGLRQVPANKIMVMGDNYMNSTDSRDEEIGAIAPDEIEGKVIKVWTSENNYQQPAL
ncbi:MAG: signal peptidase I [Proteobacteria bacterium]|nr:MAG: signal peptidase I [Pseudomonadota bacterium]